MARITKKDVYAEHGIEFNGKQIYCNPLDKWVSPMLPFGTNTKVGKAGTWSMTHGDEIVNYVDACEKVKEIMDLANVREIAGSCPFHCPDCYCDNGFYNYDSNKALNLMKLILAKFHRDWLERAIVAQIKADKIKQVRIHASGDFFSLEYAQMWRRIAETCNDVIFWTYTKVQFALDTFQDVTNVFIVPSVTPFGFNFGTCSELLYRYNKLTAMGYRVHICACGTDFEKHCSECKHGCKAVGIECDFVLFIKHSTNDYKAGVTDPEEFAKVCDIIKNQTN